MRGAMETVRMPGACLRPIVTAEGRPWRCARGPCAGGLGFVGRMAEALARNAQTRISSSHNWPTSATTKSRLRCDRQAAGRLAVLCVLHHLHARRSGHFDDETCRRETLENPFGPKSVTHVSDMIRNPCVRNGRYRSGEPRSMKTGTTRSPWRYEELRSSARHLPGPRFRARSRYAI
jgi:hypothetical protein